MPERGEHDVVAFLHALHAVGDLHDVAGLQRSGNGGDLVLMGETAPRGTGRGIGWSCSRTSRRSGRWKITGKQTFWARRFGMLVDRFGIPWMLNVE